MARCERRLRLQVIERVVTLAGASKGGCILVEGEAGMGKSRLLEEIQHTDFDGRGDEVTVLRVTASTAHRNQVTACHTGKARPSPHPVGRLQASCLQHRSRTEGWQASSHSTQCPLLVS